MFLQGQISWIDTIPFTIWMFGTRRTFENLSIDAAKNITLLWAYLNKVICSDILQTCSNLFDTST